MIFLCSNTFKSDSCIDENESQDPNSRKAVLITWLSIIPGLLCCIYRNSITSKKVKRRKHHEIFVVCSIHVLLSSVVVTARKESAPSSSYRLELPEAWTKPLQVGDRVPDVEFMTRSRIQDDSLDEKNSFDWNVLSSDDYFAKKRVVLFAIPGAFTPTCSSMHLPGYEARYQDIRALAIDEVYCLSVNDVSSWKIFCRFKCLGERVREYTIHCLNHPLSR
jgi:hypothetical protein